MKRARAVNYAVVILLALCSVGCNKKNTFPGYTKISHDGSSNHTVYVSKESVQKSYSGQVAMSLVVEEPDGKYSLFNLTTDCADFAQRETGTRYKKDGTILSSISGDSQTVSLMEIAELQPAISEACTWATELRSFTGSFDIGKAMVLVFGNYNPEMKTSSWSKQDGYVQQLNATSGTVSVVLDAPYVEGKTSKHLVVAATVPAGEAYDCHSCCPRMSGFVFSNENEKWIAEVDQRELNLPRDGYGHIPAVKLVRVGPDRFALLGGEIFFQDLLLPTSGHFTQVLEVKMLDDNSETCGDSSPCYLSKAKYEFQPPGQNPEMFDIRLTESGTKLVNGQLASDAEVIVYSFSKEKNKYLPLRP